MTLPILQRSLSLNKNKLLSNELYKINLDSYKFSKILNCSQEKNNPDENLSLLEKSIIEVVSEESREKNPIANEILIRFESIRKKGISPRSESCILVSIFANLTNSNWITLG